MSEISSPGELEDETLVFKTLTFTGPSILEVERGEDGKLWAEATAGMLFWKTRWPKSPIEEEYVEYLMGKYDYEVIEDEC